jgi:DNA-binding PadR family transcriptional regulator
MTKASSKLSPAELLAELQRGCPDEPRAAALGEERGGGGETAASCLAASDKSGGDYIKAGRGAVCRRRTHGIPDAARGNSQLAELFERVNSLLGSGIAPEDEFIPRAPETFAQIQMTEEEIERLALKFLLQRGSASGRQIASQIRLPFQIIDPLLKEWKREQFIALRGAAEVGDYVYAITELGRARAKQYSEECSYFGAAPVSLEEYLQAMEAQSIARQQATEEDLHRAFADLLISEAMFDRLGPAVNSGRGMFLFGEPGNGKTSIAERITSCFGSTIWIPRALGIDGDIIRLFDPGVHDPAECPSDGGDGLFDLSGVDQRWVRIVRPTVVAGGELTMEELEVVQNPQTKICEAPLQLKSNCGTLVIDDFGRQTMPVEVLLNRWIVPLEKRYDFLNLPSGKKVQVPFDQLIIFSTNLEPRDLVDGAFLRRIPYKIEVPDPSPEHFRRLFEIMAPKLGLIHDPAAVEYLIETHYLAINRPFRACQPRDLLLQIRNYCTYKKQPKKVTPEGFDFAVANYFSVM